jgi:crotonobetainyl-CoA:carnitine CoA-transferase CaiB-like acyl-CoA transferase
MLLAFGISTALFVRQRDGIGQHIDGSLIGGMVAMQSKQIMEFLRTGKQSGFQRRRAATYTNYECADGRHIAIAAQDQKYWELLCDAIGEGWLRTDERFASPWGRVEYKHALVDELDRIFRTRPMEDWLEPLAAAGVPHAPVLDYAGMVAQEQYWANDYLVNIETPHLGPLRVPGAPIHMSATPPRVESAGPMLGADTEEILLAVGYNWEEIAAFKECGATRTA